jgi:carbohydrate diacid regulator
MLTSDIAENIVKETMDRLDRNINLMDIEGTIIASGNQQRIGEHHIGAREAIQSGNTIRIYEENLAQWEGARPGINMPIIFQNQTVGAIGITGHPDEVYEIAKLVRMTTELMLRQSYLSSRQEWRNRLKESVLEELVKSDSDASKVEEQLTLLQLRLKAPIQTAVIRLERSIGYHSLLLRRIEELYGSQRVLVGLLSEHRIAVITFGMEGQTAADKLDMLMLTLDQLGGGYLIGCSGEASEQHHISILIKEAGFALQHASGERRLVRYAGLEPQMIVSQAEADTRTRYLERLFSDMTEDLLKTLQAFLDCNLNIRQTADELYVHKNTVIYRLKKIKEVTGCDPQVFHDAAALQIALWIAKRH